MRILFLGSDDSEIYRWLCQVESDVAQTQEPIGADLLERGRPDFLVSHGYRHILPEDVCTRYAGRAVNLHISLLPWNRGADPNLWSWIDDTPKGVTIHHISAGLDAGDIVAQQEIELGDHETLASSYAALQDAMRVLFEASWPALRAGTAAHSAQPPGGSYHRVRDRARVEHQLTRGWDTPVRELRPSPR